MTGTDVQIRIIGKDDASAVLQKVAGEASSAQRQFESFGSSMLSVHSVLQNTVAYASAITGLNGITEALHSAVGSALEFYNTMQTGSISLAGSLMSMGQINGQAIQWNEALGMSKTLMRELSDQALVTGASTKEISEVFRAMLPNALNAKMTIEQTMKLASAFTTTGKAMGISGDILARDVRDVINGRNVERTTLGMQLGLTNEEIQQAKQSADGLFNFLSERLRGEMEANGHYLETFEGRWNHLKESISRVGGEALSPVIQQATDEISTLANKLVAVDTNTGKVLGINGDVIEGIRDGAIVVEHFASGIAEVGQDLSTVFTPALKAAAALIEVGAQHTTALTEAMIALWVGRKLSYYVTDYRNAITGAATAQTALGRAAEQARIQITAEAEAQRQVNLAKAQNSMAALSGASMMGKLDTAGIAKQIALEASLGNQMQRNIELTIQRVTAAQTARTAFEGAAAAMKAGEMELATKILETTATLEAQGTAAELMSARASEAIALVKAGQADLAAQIVETTLANELQGTQSLASAEQGVAGAAMAGEAQTALKAKTVETNVATIATGTAAAASGAKIVSMGAVAGQAIKNLTSLTWNLIGGWLGVAVAIGTALYKLYEYASAERDWESNHSYWYKGATWVVDRNGGVKRQDSGAPTVPDWTGVGADWDQESPEDIEAIKKLNAQHEEELKRQQEEQEKNEMIASMEKSKRIMGEISNERPDLINQVTGKYAGGEGDGEGGSGAGSTAAANKEAAAAQREAAKAAREQAQANKEYANVITENARRIAQANEKVTSIIENLNDKLLDLNGTQLQIDLNKITREVNGVNKEIAKSVVELKKFVPGTATTGGSSVGDAIYQYGASRDGTPYLLGGDGLSATDCGKLFSDAVFDATGERLPRYVPDIIAAVGDAWHPAGDGYVPAKGDGVVVLGDGHIVISNGEGGYVGANSSTGVIEKPSVTEDFGEVTGYISMAQLFPQQAGSSSSVVMPTISQNSVSIPQTPSIQTIEEVSQEMNASDLLKILLAIATYESGDQKNISTIGSNTYNPASGASGIFQILPGQDYLGDDGQRHAIPDDYADTDRQNTIAAIDLLRGKIREANGDIWEGVKHYGENTEEYVAGVRSIYDSLGGDGINLAPMGTELYKSPFMSEAYQKLSEYQKEAIKNAMTEWQQRRSKYADEAEITADEIGMNGGDGRLWSMQRELQKTLREIDEKRKDVYKQVVGKGADDKEGEAIVNRYQEVQKEKARQEELEKERELMKTEHEERQTHLTSMAYLQNDFAYKVNQYQQQELQSFTKYQQEQLETAKLTQEQRIKLEQELYENMQKLHSLEAKTDWGAGLQELGRSMRSYTQDIGSALNQGWSSLTDTMEGAFDNMLTENESFSERMRNLYISVANTILNTMMKIIMQGLIMHAIMQACGMGANIGLSSDITSSAISTMTGGLSFGSGTSLPASYTYHHSAIGFASGGIVSPGYFIAGEEGRELVEMSGTNGYVHNARETAEILNGSNDAKSGIENVEVRIVNQSGQQVKSTQATAQVDGKKLIVTTMLEAVATDYMGSRTMLKGALG